MAPRLFAGVMLGRLAPVLRFLGLDTSYGKPAARGRTARRQPACSIISGNVESVRRFVPL